MLRIGVIIALLLSLVALGREAMQSWQPVSLPKRPTVIEKKKSGGLEKKPLSSFYPKPPVVMPNLDEGYLFTEARVRGEEEVVEEAPPEEVENPEGSVDMETLQYVGSIIIGELRKGMLSFSLRQPQSKSTPQRRIADRRSSHMRKVPKKGSLQKKHATVSEKDEFYGYQVSEVGADRIVFAKGDATVEKMLYDPEKERMKAPPVAKRPPVARTPQQARRATAANPNQAAPRTAVRGKPQVARPAPASPVHARTGAAVPTRNDQRPAVVQRRRVPVRR